MKLTFVEALWFTPRLKARADDELYRALQNEIAEQPDKGKVMPGCGGLRKLRFADPARGKGKRGGLRIVYLYIPEASRMDFFDVYDKNEKDDLTPKEKKLLAELAKTVRQEAIDAFRRSGGKS
jgi:hypothetical protein